MGSTRNRTVRSALILAAGTLAAQGVTFLGMPVLTRLYPPAEFAYYALFISLVQVATQAGLLRTDTLCMLPMDEERCWQLLGGGFWCCLGLALLIALALLVLPSGLLGVVASLAALALPAGAAIVATAAVNLLLGHALRREDHRTVALGRVLLNALTLGCAWLLTLHGAAHGLELGYLAGVLASAVLLWMLTPSFAFTLRQSLSELGRYRQRILHLHPAALIDLLTLQLPVWLVFAWFSPAQAGMFSMAWRLMAIPLGLLGSAIGPIFYSRFARLFHETPAQAESCLRYFWSRMVPLSLLMYGVLVAMGDTGFTLFLGEKWRGVGVLARWMAPMFCFMAVSSPTSTAMIVLGLERWSLPFALWSLLTRVLAFYVGKAMGSLQVALVVWAGVEIAAIIVFNLLMLKGCRQHVRIST